MHPTLGEQTGPSHTLPFPESYRRRAGPSLGCGSHIEAQIGTQFSALGSHCRIPGVCWRRAKTPTPIRPSTGGGLPVCTGSSFRKEKMKCRIFPGHSQEQIATRIRCKTS